MAKASRRAEVLRDASDCVFGPSARTGKGKALARDGATMSDGEKRDAPATTARQGLPQDQHEPETLHPARTPGYFDGCPKMAPIPFPVRAEEPTPDLIRG